MFRTSVCPTAKPWKTDTERPTVLARAVGRRRICCRTFPAISFPWTTRKYQSTITSTVPRAHRRWTPPASSPPGPCPASIDFALYEHPEKEPFKALFFGDTQARGLREVNFVTHDVVEECIGTNAIFGVSLGDIVADDPPLWNQREHRPNRRTEWYNVFGNHDNNGAATEHKYSDDTFERYFGPSTYAFEYGEVAFIPLNNIYFPPGEKGYKASFTDQQVAFVKNYLAHATRKEKLVVLMMHVPIARCGKRDDMLALLANGPNTLTVAAHVHEQFHIFMG